MTLQQELEVHEGMINDNHTMMLVLNEANANRTVEDRTLRGNLQELDQQMNHMNHEMQAQRQQMHHQMQELQQMGEEVQAFTEAMTQHQAVVTEHMEAVTQQWGNQGWYRTYQ